MTAQVTRFGPRWPELLGRVAVASALVIGAIKVFVWGVSA